MEKSISVLKKNKKGKEKKERKPLDKKQILIAFDILAVFCILIVSFSITPKTLQNDTFYTIKLGQLVRKNGIDFKDHFSMHKGLPYMYPHWLYDIAISLIFDNMGGFTGIYISTIILSCILGISLYYTQKKYCKNNLISFAMTLEQMYIMRQYICARAQTVTFILFVLQILVMEKYIEKPKKRYILYLLLIPTLIANVHSAVWPFSFILYLPYIVEYAFVTLKDMHILNSLEKNICNNKLKKANKNLKNGNVSKEKLEKIQFSISYYTKKLNDINENFEKYIFKDNEKRKNPNKIILERNNNVSSLVIVMVIALFTGLLTPIKDMPYTYTLRIMLGNTTQNINEHLPLTLINEKIVLAVFLLFFGIMIFTKAKIRLRDLFMFGGMSILCLMSRRQVSMFTLFGGFVFARIISELIDRYDPDGTMNFMNKITTITGEVITILAILCFSLTIYRNISNDPYISSSYPVEASTWIINNIDYKNSRIYNDYNYGSYLLYRDIPVFIDSRCDLYTPEFNGKLNFFTKEVDGGEDYFSKFMDISNISTWYEDKFEEYKIDYVITKSNSKLNMLLSRDKNYEEIYKDENFKIYNRLNSDKTDDLYGDKKSNDLNELEESNTLLVR